MSPTLTPHQLAEQWLTITVERFVANIRKLRIGNTGQLLASFRKEVIAAAGADQMRLRLSYALYGQFVDMGVGRGMGAGQRKGSDGYERVRNSRGRLRRHERKAKRWYSTEMAHQTHRLSELLLDLYGTVALAQTQNVGAGAGDLTLTF
jgi:hypothetical protein